MYRVGTRQAHNQGIWYDDGFGSVSDYVLSKIFRSGSDLLTLASSPAYRGVLGLYFDDTHFSSQSMRQTFTFQNTNKTNQVHVTL